MSHYKLIANPNCCEKCEEKDNHWMSKDTDLNAPVHPNCKCTVIEELSKSEKAAERKAKAKAKARKTKKVKNEETNEITLEEVAMNDPIQEEYYTGFTYVNPMSEETPIPEAEVTTYDFGSTLVQISPLGNFLGSDAKGKEVKEEITIDSLRNVLANIKEEILVDIDHASEREGIDRDTSAAAWASDFIVIDGLSELDNGLYARLRWTEKGRKLVEDRTYRFLSPVFILDDKNQPLSIKSVALTNTPALKGISPIINSEPTSEPSKTTSKPGHTMDKEICNMCGIEPKGEEVTDEEKSAVMEKLKSWKDAADKADAERAEAEKAAKEKEVRNAYDALITDYEVEDTDDLYEMYKKDSDGFSKVLCACGKKKVKNEEPKDEPKEESKEETKEEPKEEPKEEAPKLKEEDEVIEKEALNSAAVPKEMSLKSKAELLHGDEFIDFVKKHKEQLVAEW